MRPSAMTARAPAPDARAVRRCAACGLPGPVRWMQVAGRVREHGLIPTTDAYGTALADLVRCPACGHGQLERLPSDRELVDAYAAAESTDYVDEEAGQRETARRTLARIERHAPVGRLLDVGCWVGFLLAEARERGWQGTGVEPSAFASSWARDRLGLDVRTGSLFTEDLPAGSFDAVVLGDVLEHLPHPGEALERIAELAIDGGIVAMAVPDAGSPLARAMGARWWSVIPTHVHYFTHRSLRALLERHGFRVLEVATSPKVFSVRYYLGRIGGYSATGGAALVRAAEAAGIADRLWAPDFGDRMLVMARAPSPLTPAASPRRRRRTTPPSR